MVDRSQTCSLLQNHLSTAGDSARVGFVVVGNLEYTRTVLNLSMSESLSSGHSLPMEGAKLTWLASHDSGFLGWLLADPFDLAIVLWVIF